MCVYGVCEPQTSRSQVLDEDRQNSTYKHVSKIIQKVTLLITALRQNEE